MSGQPLLCAECFGHGEVFYSQPGGITKSVCGKCEGSGRAAVPNQVTA